MPIRELVRRKSVTMEYFLETSHLDHATADLLRRYDVDGDGTFSKDEVVAIILDLREAMQSNEVLGASNKMIKRLLIAATIFCVLLLTSMFGLTYAVAALTANTDVKSDGLMMTRDGSFVIATDSSATLHRVSSDESGVTCMTSVELGEIQTAALEGRNVLLETDTHNGTHSSVQQLTAGGYVFDAEAGTMCFGSTQGSQVCFQATESCLAPEERQRRLSQTIDQACLDEPYPTDLLAYQAAVLCEFTSFSDYMKTCGCKRLYAKWQLISTS